MLVRWNANEHLICLGNRGNPNAHTSLSSRGAKMLTCEFHGCTFPKGYTCPACQRTDANIMTIWKEIRELAKQVAEIKRNMPIKDWKL